MGAQSTGKCSFCKSEIGKGRMTTHLKSCKERMAVIAAETGESKRKKPTARLFQLLVEGRYNPQYWMHIEVPAQESLQTLDDFLRDIWLECCGHLSAFKIDGVSYENNDPEGLGTWQFEF